MSALEFLIADLDRRGPFFWLLVGALTGWPWWMP